MGRARVADSNRCPSHARVKIYYSCFCQMQLPVFRSSKNLPTWGSYDLSRYGFAFRILSLEQAQVAFVVGGERRFRGDRYGQPSIALMLESRGGAIFFLLGKGSKAFRSHGKIQASNGRMRQASRSCRPKSKLAIRISHP
ncbi:MAG: hypothetical protein K0S36_1400 [Nitrosospira multiformis]|jgi:hypothetical protein|nr:hypothetical protein [Nitrosospira multiformis]